MATVETKKKEETKLPDGEELVKIKLFYDGRDYANDVFVAVNGDNMIIKRGVEVEIPRKFAEVIQNAEAQKQAATRARRKLAGLE